jgi:hypothetical protein
MCALLVVHRDEALPLRPSPGRRSTQKQPFVRLATRRRSARCRASYVHATRLPFDPGSPAELRALAASGVLRGGALEPEPRRGVTKWQAKANANCLTQFLILCRGIFLPQAGPRFDLVLLKLGITSRRSSACVASETTKATRWVALDWLVYAASGASCTTSQRGLWWRGRRAVTRIRAGTDGSRRATSRRLELG